MQVRYQNKSLRLAYKGIFLPETDVASGPPSPLDHIEIIAQPYKQVYSTGESFDPTGMSVWAILEDGTALPVNHSALTFTPSVIETTTESVQVNLTWGSVTKTSEVTIYREMVFGVAWNSGNSSTALTRLGPDNDPNNYCNVSITEEPIPAVGTSLGSSPFDNFYPWRGMEEYNIENGQVTCKKGDPLFTRTGTADVMIYIPEFWYKRYTNGDYTYWYISSVARSEFEKHPGSGKYVSRYTVNSNYKSISGAASIVNISRASARTTVRTKGAGWQLYDYATLCAIQFLYLVEYADWNSQAKIGRGYVDGNSSALPSGATDDMVYHTGRDEGVNGKTMVQYRGIENPWGNLYQIVDGININNRMTYFCTDPSMYLDNTDDGYIESYTVPSSSGYIQWVDIGNSSPFLWAFFPIITGGTSDNYITDYCNIATTGWKGMAVGGGFASKLQAGLWDCYMALNNFTGSGDIGIRSEFVP